ncbi:MAG: patatin family protein [Polyangiales bacterium]
MSAGGSLSGDDLVRVLRPGRRIVVSLPGGGITGALYQLGALAALEDSIEGFHANALGGYVAVGSGAALAAGLAGGLELQRIYRGLLDPADTFFPLERRHVIRVDLAEWRRTFGAALAALRRVLASATTRPVETAVDPWQEIDRFHDVLPAGLFSLEHLEHFLESFFERRGLATTFRALPRPLIVPVHELDTGEVVLFGDEGHVHDRIARVVCASSALPLFFAPVRIGDRLFFAGSTGNAVSLDVAVARLDAEAVLVVNPLVPVAAEGARVPTGHGDGTGVRDKGMLWVYNQAMRIGERAHLAAEAALLRARRPDVDVAIVEPAQADAVLFMHSPMNYSARRAILEDSYRSVRERLRGGG